MKRLFAMGAFAALFFTATSPVSGAQNQTMTQTNEPVAVATLGGGCFWCTEAIYKMLPGVKSIVSGYAGGKVENPTYQQVCTGASGHAEVIQISYDPSRISYETILKTFWEVHDPTTLNQQGADIGTQYRSVIMFHDAAQKAIAEKSKIEAQKQFTRPIVTEIVPFDKFYAAEGYHQDYYKNNPMQGYCRAVIRPKVEKFEKKMKEKPASARMMAEMQATTQAVV
jgi:methionine-S-sulfoxide reductase